MCMLYGYMTFGACVCVSPSYLCCTIVSVLNQQQAQATSGISDGSCIVSIHKDDKGACILVLWSTAMCHLFL